MYLFYDYIQYILYIVYSCLAPFSRCVVTLCFCCLADFSSARYLGRLVIDFFSPPWLDWTDSTHTLLLFTNSKCSLTPELIEFLAQEMHSQAHAFYDFCQIIGRLFTGTTVPPQHWLMYLYVCVSEGSSTATDNRNIYSSIKFSLAKETIHKKKMHNGLLYTLIFSLLSSFFLFYS